MKKVLFPIIIIGFLFACTHPYVGKQVPPGYWRNCPSIKGSDHHTLMLQHLTVDFNHSINPSKNKISLDGFVRLRKDQAPSSWTITELFIEVWFLDSAWNIIKVKSFTLTPMKVVSEPIPFKKTFPYDSRYSFITFNYRIKGH